MHAWVRADDSAHGRCYACGARQRRGAGWLQSGVDAVNCVQMQTISKRASCTRRYARTTARMGDGVPAPCAKDGARVGCKAAWTRQTAPKCASCTRGCARTPARMGGAMPAACAKDGARVGCKAAWAWLTAPKCKLRPNARHARGCARQRAWAAMCRRRAPRICSTWHDGDYTPLSACGRVPGAGAARQRCSDGNCALSQKSAGLRLTLSMLKGVSYI